MNGPLQVGELIRDEWIHIIRDKRLFAILFLIPLLYTALFGYLYSQQRVTEIKTVVYDGDQTEWSRKIIQAFHESESFQIVEQSYSEHDVKKAIEKNKVKAGIIIPPEFSARVKRGEIVPIMTLIDGSNMLFSNAASRSANQIISTFGSGITAIKLSHQGLQEEQIAATLSAIPFRTRILYNPAFNYSHFLVFGLMGAILQQVILLGVALTVTREKEKGTWNRFFAWKHIPWKIAYAKTAPYFLIGILNHLTVFSLGLHLFGLPFRGYLIPALALIVSFVFALLGIGYLASLFSPNQLQATQTTMLVAVPSFLLSGFTWPFEAMPHALDIFGHMLPLTYLLDGVRELFVKGHGWDMIWKDCVALSMMGLCTYLFAFIMTPFRFKPKKEQMDSTLAA